MLKVVKYNICVRSFKNVLPTFHTQFSLKFIYSEATDVSKIRRCEFLYRCNDIF